MKNIKFNSFILVVLGLFLFSSCDTEPLADEIKEIQAGTAIGKDITYTLVEDDYETADEVCGCSGFGNFSSEDDVKIAIPVVLEDVFPALGDGSSAVITYDFYNGSSPDLRGTYTEVTVPTEDYDLYDGDAGFDNFGNPDEDVIEWMEWKGFTGEDGDYYDVTFDYFDGSFNAGAVSRIIYTVAYGWQYVWIAPQEVYDFTNESSSCYGVPDFSFEDEASDVIPVYLNEFNTLFKEEGDILVVQFNYDDGSDCVTEEDATIENPANDPTETDVIMYIFDGEQWVEYGDGYQTTQESLSFGHNGDGWEADNTIKYTLGSADYSAISAAYASINTAGSESMDNFGNYDLTLWSSQEIFDSITARLEEIFPTVVDQKYLVEYAVWRPGAGTEQIKVIWNGTAYELVP